jgi:hypothetical protein
MLKVKALFGSQWFPPPQKSPDRRCQIPSNTSVTFDSTCRQTPTLRNPAALCH